MTTNRFLLYTVLCHLCSAPIRGQDEEADQDRIEALEQRVAELEDGWMGLGAIPDWLSHLRISGSANVGYYDGESDSFFPEGTFQVWDTRFFLDADLGSEIELGGQTVVRNTGFTFEWDLVRLGSNVNRVGELYVDLQGIMGWDALNAQFGRFQIPVGENYLRFSKGYAGNPFVSNTVGGPWWWDEGIRLYGQDPSGRLGYVASVSDGDNSFNRETDENKQLTLKLYADPTDWLHVSVSSLRSGKIGNSSSPAFAALWLGEAFPQSFGTSSAVPNYDNGAVIPDGPFQLDNVTLFGADAVITVQDYARLWLAYGVVDIDSDGSRVYDRTLKYWISELLLNGTLVAESLEPFYVGLRANGLGTYDRDEGYLLDFRYGKTLGFNMESLEAYSIVAGWDLTDDLALRAEYTIQDIDMIRGVAPGIKAAADSANYFAVEFLVRF